MFCKFVAASITAVYLLAVISNLGSYQVLSSIKRAFLLLDKLVYQNYTYYSPLLHTQFYHDEEMIFLHS